MSNLLTSRFVRFDEEIDTGYLIDAHECEVALESVVEFKVYEAVRFKDGTVEIQDKSGCSQHWTNIKEDGEVYLEGDIKWDGCSHWSFHPEDHAMLHICRTGAIDELAWLLRQCFEIAKELMPHTEFGDDP